MHNRTLNLPDLLDRKSHFLSGARATRETTLIQRQLPDALLFDLLHAQTYATLVRNPSVLGGLP